MTVSFIVVNWNGGSLLRQCLASIESQTFTDHEIILVDNGSTDASCDEAVREFPRILVLRHAENLGFAEANNRALQTASGDLIALVNNDATLDRGWTRAMADALRARPDAGSAACLIVQAHAKDLVDSAGFAFYDCASVDAWKGMSARSLAVSHHRPFGPVASAAVYRRSALEAVGHFHREYFCYYEDTDLAARLVLWGYPTVYVPEAIAYHRGSHTGKERSDFHIYHLRRNVEYLYWVDMVGYLAWLNLPLHLLYEGLALGVAVRDRQAGVVLRAKRDAFAARRWIADSRKQLREKLERQGLLRQAQANLRRASRFGLPLLARLRNLRRRRPREDDGI